MNGYRDLFKDAQDFIERNQGGRIAATEWKRIHDEAEELKAKWGDCPLIRGVMQGAIDDLMLGFWERETGCK